MESGLLALREDRIPERRLRGEQHVEERRGVIEDRGRWMLVEDRARAIDRSLRHRRAEHRADETDVPAPEILGKLQEREREVETGGRFGEPRRASRADR